jgi:hypothetical protein
VERESGVPALRVELGELLGLLGDLSLEPVRGAIAAATRSAL